METSSLVCRACGSPLEPGDAWCRACGALAVGDDEMWRAARAAEAPTEVIPAVELPAEGAPGPAQHVPDAEQHPRAPAPPVTSALAAPPPPVVAYVPARSGAGSRRRLLVGLLAGSTLVLAALAVAVGVGGLSSLLGPAASTSPPAAGVGESPTESGTAAPAALSCAPRELVAPAPGRWRLYRAEYGRRDRFDYLRLQLRRDGDHEQVAGAVAEIVAPADVDSRFDAEPPADADVALVVAFNGPVSISRPWGARADYAALRDFRVARGREGNVHVVVGVRGAGCFELSGWDTDSAEVTLEIERP